MPKITKKNKEDRKTVRNWFRSKEGQKALVANDLMLDPQGRPISVMLPEAEVSTLGNAPRDLSKDFLEGIRYGAGMVPLLGETLDYAESAYANKYGTDFFGNPMHGPLNAGITTAGIVIPNVVEKPVKAGFKVVKNALPKIGPILKKFESSIDWGKWNPDIPKNKDLMKEYREIEKRTKKDGTWMKNPDGTEFSGHPALFVQMQSKAFKEAFPEGYDKIYRGDSTYDGQGLTPTSKSRNLKGDAQFFSEDRSQAEQYAKSGAGNRETVGADYADMQSGVYEMAYPPDTPRLDLDTRGSGFSEIELFSEKTIPELESQISELKEIMRTSKNSSEKSNAAYNLSWIEEALKYIKDNPNPRRVSSDAEVADFLEKYRSWAQHSDDVDMPDGMLTDDIAMFMEENPDLYDRIVLRGLDDESIGDVNIINTSKAPYPKSLKGNVGTFDLNDPNVFKALIPAVGAGAIMSHKNKDMSSGGTVRIRKKVMPNAVKVSVDGYRRFSPDRENDCNIIESNRISMRDVDHPVVGVDNHGNVKVMFPEREYRFTGSSVLEIPVSRVSDMNESDIKEMAIKVAKNMGFLK